MGLCGHHHCSHGSGRRGGPHSTHCQALGSEVSSAGSFPPTLPAPWFAWMAWMWSVRQTLLPTVRPRVQVAVVIASSFRSTLGHGWSGRPLYPFSARSLPCTGRRPVLGVGNVSLLSRARWSVSALQHCVGVCTFAAGFRRPQFSLFQEVYSEVWERDPKDAFVPRSASVVELLIAVPLVPLAGVNLRTPLLRDC